MKLNVTKDILEAMINYGDNSPELEVCGALVGKSDESSYTCTEFIPLTNRSNKNKAVHYIPDQNEFFNVLKRTTHFDSNSNLDLVGIFHTHPHHAPIPSETDILGANKFGLESLFIVNGIHKNQLNSNGSIISELYLKKFFDKKKIVPEYVLEEFIF